MFEEITSLKTVKQPNGKFALYDDKNKSFVLTGFADSTAALNHVLKRVRARLMDHVFEKDDYFDMYLEEYKHAHGLVSGYDSVETDPADPAIEKLISMGVPEETLEKKDAGTPGEVLTAEVSGDTLTMGHKLKIMELAMGDPAVTTWHDDTLLEKKYRQIRDLVLEDCAGDTGESEPE